MSVRAILDGEHNDLFEINGDVNKIRDKKLRPTIKELITTDNYIDVGFMKLRFEQCCITHDLTNVTFYKSHIQDTTISGAMDHVTFDEATLFNISFNKAHFTQSVTFEGASIQFTTFDVAEDLSEEALMRASKIEACKASNPLNQDIITRVANAIKNTEKNTNRAREKTLKKEKNPRRDLSSLTAPPNSRQQVTEVSEMFAISSQPTAPLTSNNTSFFRKLKNSIKSPLRKKTEQPSLPHPSSPRKKSSSNE